jgi:hypothetical protein
MLLAACCLLLAAYSPNCFAGAISISTQAVARVEGESVHIVIQVSNRGDAAARQVRADADLLGERFASAVLQTLSPGESGEFIFSKPLRSSLKGTFPLSVLVRFQDTNAYSFSALTCTTFTVREEGDAAISATTAPVTLEDDGAIPFQVRNKGARTISVKSTLRIPDEFSSDKPALYFPLPAGENKVLSFPIRNLSALSGAVYPVFVIQEYEVEGVKSTHVSSTLVKTAGGRNWFRETRWYWAGGGALFLVGFLVVARSKHLRNSR